MSDTDLAVDMTLKVLNITNREAELDMRKQKSVKKKSKRDQPNNYDNVEAPKPEQTKKPKPGPIKPNRLHQLAR